MANESSLEGNRKKSEMTDGEGVRNLQRKLYRKAKEEKRYWFCLYRYHRRKSRRHNERFCRNAYYIWRDKGLVDPVSHYRAATPKA